MPKRTNEFQTMVYHAYAHMAGPKDRVTESASVRERGDGAVREVDVFIEHNVLGTSLRLAVECRGRKDKDDLEWIDALLGKFKDLAVDKVFAVSRSGFSQAALKKARINRIDALTLEPISQSPWPNGLICPGLGGWSRADHPQKIRVITDPPYPYSIQINQSIVGENGTCIGSLGDLGWCIYLRYRDTITTSIQVRFFEFFKQEDDLRPGALTAIIEGYLTFPAFLDHEGKKHRITYLMLSVRCDFDHKSVPVQHFALGDARLTLATIPCGNTERAFSVVAIQAVNKPGQFRWLSTPVQLPKREDNEAPPRA